jgi:hypothetical protein
MTDSWNRKIDKAWRDKAMRREFEVETGMAPLAWFFEKDKEEKQKLTGHAFAYEHCFKAWATKKLGIFDAAPEESQEIFFLNETEEAAA